MTVTTDWQKCISFLQMSYEEAYDLLNALQECLKQLDRSKEPEWYVGFNLPQVDSGNTISIIVAKQEN